MSLDKSKLELIATDCAREAACRFEVAINQFIEAKDIKVLTSFAAIGAVRILEYLCRKRLPIELPHLLQGLIMGRSGAGVKIVQCVYQTHCKNYPFGRT